MKCKKICYGSEEDAIFRFKQFNNKECYAYQCPTHFPYWHITTTYDNTKRLLGIIKRGKAQYIKNKSKFVSDWKVGIYYVRYYEKQNKVKILPSTEF